MHVMPGLRWEVCDKTEGQAAMKYLPKKGMTPKEIAVGVVQILAEDSSFYPAVKKWAAEFNWDRNSSEDTPDTF